MFCKYRLPSIMIYLIFIISLNQFAWNVVNAKSAHGNFNFKTNGFHYLTKFGCSIGECPWKARVKLITPWNSASASTSIGSTPPYEFPTLLQKSPSTSMSVRILLDETWDSAPVSRRPTCSSMNLARISRTITLPLNGEWSDWTEGSVTQYVRPHLWYFVADDCNGVISEHIANRLNLNKEHLGQLKFQWEFEASQPNGSHFSYELFGTFKVALFHSICYGGVLMFMAFQQVREMKRTGKIHVMSQMLNVCVLTQMSSSLFHIVHLFAYSFNGYGIPFLDGVAETLAVVSQIVMSSVMIFIATGYTLNVPTAASAVESTAMPIVIVVTIFHVGLVCLDRFNADPRFKFHAADGFLGFILTLLRVMLWGGFVFQCMTTIHHHETPNSVQGFLRRFMIAGSLYFLAYPFVFGVTCLFAPYLQHKVITNGIFIMQLTSMVWLCSLFLRKGEYFKISELSQSYLPGGYLSTRGVYRLD